MSTRFCTNAEIPRREEVERFTSEELHGLLGKTYLDRVETGVNEDENTVKHTDLSKRASTVRVIRPGQPATETYCPDRLTVFLNGQGKIAGYEYD